MRITHEELAAGSAILDRRNRDSILNIATSDSASSHVIFATMAAILKAFVPDRLYDRLPRHRFSQPYR
jgi:hypothetical protein